MRPAGGSAPPGVPVQRQFEGNRLAKECQARAYQKLLPMTGRSESTTSRMEPFGGDGEESLVRQEGVAA